MSDKVRNIHKFKVKATGIVNTDSEGHVEFVGCPTVEDFANWVTRLKDRVDEVRIGAGVFESAAMVSGELDSRIRQIHWTKQSGEGYKFVVTLTN